MKKQLLLWLLILPVVSYAQGGGGAIKKHVGSTQPNKLARSADTACVCRRLNTAALFPKPPEIFALTHTPVIASTFTVNACIKNLKSADGLRLTLNGEEQPIRQQTLPADKETSCSNGYSFSYTLTPTAARNAISLEARNEGGATIRYLDVAASQ